MDEEEARGAWHCPLERTCSGSIRFVCVIHVILVRNSQAGRATGKARTCSCSVVLMALPAGPLTSRVPSFVFMETWRPSFFPGS